MAVATEKESKMKLPKFAHLVRRYEGQTADIALVSGDVLTHVYVREARKNELVVCPTSGPDIEVPIVDIDGIAPSGFYMPTAQETSQARALAGRITRRLRREADLLIPEYVSSSVQYVTDTVMAVSVSFVNCDNRESAQILHLLREMAGEGVFELYKYSRFDALVKFNYVKALAN
jgi:hypothetical protein